MKPKRLARAPIDTLVLQTGRELEARLRTLTTELDADDARPTRAERMRTLRPRIDEDSWRAYRRWAKGRNAYVHGEADGLPDRDAFLADFVEVRDALDALAAQPEPAEGPSLTWLALLVAAAVGYVVYAC